MKNISLTIMKNKILNNFLAGSLACKMRRCEWWPVAVYLNEEFA